MGFILQNLTAVIASGISLVSLFFSARIHITSVSHQLEEKKTVFSDKLCTVKFNLSLIEVFAGYISESASTSGKGREPLAKTFPNQLINCQLNTKPTTLQTKITHYLA